MRDVRAFAEILGPEWAITHEAMRSMIEIADRQGEGPEAVEARLGRPLENTHNVEIRGSVAVIPVRGPLFRHANMLTRVSGATSYAEVAQDLRAALENPDVRSIVLNIDSPGGSANGVAELASHIYDARGDKEVVAYVGGLGASAAYWLASAASRIVANKTAMLGSVGVVVGVRKGDGNTDEIVSSQSPYKRVDTSTAEGRARVQAMVDNLAALFIADVAQHRGVSEEHVSEKFGKGDLLLGGAALEAGMVDELGTFEGLVAALNEGKKMGKTQTGEISTTMTVEQLQATYPGLVEQIRAEGVASVNVEVVKAEAFAAGEAKGRDSERVRVLGIIGHAEAKGREALALKLAGMPTMGVEGAAEIMGSTPKTVAVATPATEFDAVMKGKNPNVDADADAGEHPDEEQAHLAAMKAIADKRIAANRKPF